ncbi:DNA primase large subunit [Halogranum gelatinilyticum]|uniref:DNA primase large subunit PriL n=1 Tax=Halogranum gelatinilyticum TaxID=660521 RepID=A0A1G9P7E8_9EURY|nr:DNA primase large subunit PriL [Halogranum gelatinilyticum]SDL94802.1 DNA primase large subunit [Halogranum gelatinilyticum]
MNPLHARYPFFEGAREAVEASGVALPTLVAEDAPAVERGRERVERALLSGTTASETPREWSVEDELLSYPIARILVSLIDAPAAVRKYAAAEAATAADRFAEDFETDDEGLKSTSQRTVTLDRVLDEFDFDDEIHAEPPERGNEPHWFRVALGSYLTLADGDWGDGWRLVNREVVDGDVRVTRDELERLLREAVERRVAEGLPFQVRGTAGGDQLADSLEEEIATLRDLLADRREVRQIDTVAPELFPPCMTHLVERVRRDNDLDAHSTFALTAFLTGIGMDTDEVVRFYRETPLDEETVRYQTEYLRDGSGAQFAAPTCATMQAYGDCVNKDERCETIAHPMSYYEKALDEADEVVDWREA